ncbi:transcriptional regulator domain-containing protein [Caulobacter segnis]|uniref:transcriptional regulator domain-containing protein n=1 Tax=Caulobacter segnis TaxID=88688 RepID=UPI0028625E50|nr:DUF6499 domain-containing protein [Caulobacter segnis]MDR6624496.1 hypothetical protein [Caulobacter segnis]
MSPDASRWRSADAYDYLDELSAADLAWEYLRRNPDYQNEFQTASQGQGQDTLSARWGLRFPRRSVA